MSPAKHSYWRVTDGQTDRQTEGQTDDGQSDPYVSLCFAGDTKMTHLCGSKFVVIVFSFIVHTKNSFFVGTGIYGSEPPQKPRKLVPNEN